MASIESINSWFCTYNITSNSPNQVLNIEGGYGNKVSVNHISSQDISSSPSINLNNTFFTEIDHLISNSREAIRINNSHHITCSLLQHIPLKFRRTLLNLHVLKALYD